MLMLQICPHHDFKIKNSRSSASSLSRTNTRRPNLLCSSQHCITTWAGNLDNERDFAQKSGRMFNRGSVLFLNVVCFHTVTVFKMLFQIKIIMGICCVFIALFIAGRRCLGAPSTNLFLWVLLASCLLSPRNESCLIRMHATLKTQTDVVLPAMLSFANFLYFFTALFGFF